MVLCDMGGFGLVFSSLIFLYLFLPLSFIFYFLSKNITYRNAILVLFSLTFYAWGEPVWIILLIFSAATDYFHGIIIEKHRGTSKMKAALISSLVLNLSLLGFFKYSSFLSQNINALFGTNIPGSTFDLPIGISFYTFQTISYVVDVYRNETKAQTSFLKFLLFVSLFHQLVAGPIVRYSDIAAQIDERHVTLSDMYGGINRFIVGLGKKVLLANTAGEIAQPILNGDINSLTTIGAWIGIILYSMQIYFDFSGYSDMAIGMGKMIGFHYKENFNYPYIAKSVTDFWRRWHISLSSFFRDYLYIPLGGNKNHHYRNLLIVWFLTGLWHGASWNFVLWGLFYGVLIILEKKVLLGVLEKIPSFLSHIYLLIITNIAWVFFYFTDLNKVFSFLGIMFGIGANGFVNVEDSMTILNNGLFIIIAAISCTPIAITLRKFIEKKIEGWKYKDLVPDVLYPAINVLLMLLCTAFLVGRTYNPFLYFRF